MQDMVRGRPFDFWGGYYVIFGEKKSNTINGEENCFVFDS